MVLRDPYYIMDRWNNGYVEGYIKKRKEAVIPKGRSTGISPAEYLISCKEKASASCIEFEAALEISQKTPLKSKITKTPIKNLLTKSILN